MLEERYYSVRMRAAQNGAHEQGGKHISGGELLSTYDKMKEAVNHLLEKALTHSRGTPDFMQIQFEPIEEPIQRIPPLQVVTREVESAKKGQAVSRLLLEKSGVKRPVIEKAYTYATEHFDIRGAILVDSYSGERLDDRDKKGVRVSRMDWINNNFKKWACFHQVPDNSRVKEALVLAAKVSAHPATVAEWCWSDDPEYVTGYVAGKKLGYQRITKLKEYGDEQGCRIFFVDGATDLSAYIDYLEKRPVFIEWESNGGGEDED